MKFSNAIFSTIKNLTCYSTNAYYNIVKKKKQSQYNHKNILILSNIID